MDVNRKELSTIKALLAENPQGMTVTEIAKSILINRHSAAKYLEVLVAAGQVDMKTFGPSKVYHLSQRVPISAMLSFSSDLIITLDRDMRAVNVNNRFLEFTGLTRQQVVNKNIENFPYSSLTSPPLIPYARAALDGKETSVDVFYPKGEHGHYFIMKSLPTAFENGEKGATLIMSDITERKRIENAIRESERKLRDMLEQSTDGISMSDEQGVIVEFNGSFERLTGLQRSEVIGKPMWKVPFIIKSYSRIFNRSSRQVKERILQFLSIGKSLEADQHNPLHIERPDGTVRIVLFNMFAIKTAKGFILCSKAHDVTDRVRAEEALLQERLELEIRVKERTADLEKANVTLEAEIEKRIISENLLRESKEKYRNLVESINDVVWEVDKEGRFTYMSPRVLNRTGYEPEDYIGRTMTSFLAPHDQEGIIAAIHAAMTNPQPSICIEVNTICRDGGELIIEANSIVMYDENGSFQGYRTVSRDITARKRAEDALRAAEERFRSLVENVSDWIWETDSVGRFTYSNPRIYDMLGYRPEEVIGITPFDLMPPEYGKKMYYRMMGLAQKGEPFSSIEGQHLHKDGHIVYVDVSGMPIRDKSGAVVGYTGIARDTIERKIAEERLVKTTTEFKDISNSFPYIIFRIRNDGTVIGFNSSRPRYLSVKPEEFLSRKICNAFPEDVGKKIGAAIRQANATDQMTVTEYSLIIEGREIFFEARLQPVPGNQIVIIIRPITGNKSIGEAYRESENRFRNTIESFNDIVWEIDSQARFTFISSRTQEILGYSPEHYLGKIIVEFIPPEDLPIFSEGFGRILANPRPYSLERMRMFHRDGSILSIEVNGSPFYDQKGQFCGFWGVARDITKRNAI